MTRERFMKVFVEETMDVVRSVMVEWGLPASPAFLRAVEELYRDAGARIPDQLLEEAAGLDDLALRALLRASGEPGIREALEGLRPARVRALAFSRPDLRLRVLH